MLNAGLQGFKKILHAGVVNGYGYVHAASEILLDKSEKRV